MPPEVARALADRLQHRLDHLTKPLGALGRLEALALKIGVLQGTDRPALVAPQLVVFAADHGLAAQGVSAYPADVTAQMVGNFLAGGAAVNVLARQHGLALTVVDAGVRTALPPHPRLVDRRIGPGTADASLGPAMSADACRAAVAAGAAVVAGLPGNALLLGEMGIGNTSAAALLVARLTGHDIDACTGRGTGLSDDALAAKRRVLRRVLERHAGRDAPLEALAAFGGYEIAMMVGAAIEAARGRRLVVVDGFIVGAAILVASRLEPALLGACVFAHRSAEAGHRVLLDALGAEPLLDGMASFDAAGVSTATGG